MKQPNVTVYGSRDCPDTSRTTALLDQHGVPYEFKDVKADPDFGDYAASLNGGKLVMPTLRINNATFINPTEDELAEAFREAQAES